LDRAEGLTEAKGWLTPGILLRPVYFSFCQLEVSLVCPRQAPLTFPCAKK
jgi:hypothetical protein